MAMGFQLPHIVLLCIRCADIDIHLRISRNIIISFVERWFILDQMTPSESTGHYEKY
ncbi:hypothetical protein BC629DRAFT_1480912, partial [Irpex lacteus]